MPAGLVVAAGFVLKRLQRQSGIARRCSPATKGDRRRAAVAGRAWQTRLVVHCHLGGRCNQRHTLSAIWSVGRLPSHSSTPSCTLCLPGAMRLCTACTSTGGSMPCNWSRSTTTAPCGVSRHRLRLPREGCGPPASSRVLWPCHDCAHHRAMQCSGGGRPWRSRAISSTILSREHSLCSPPWLGGYDIRCTCHHGGTGRRATSATPWTPRRRGACHLSSQGEQRRAVPLLLCNFLKTKTEGKTLRAGTGFAFSWREDRTHVAPRWRRRETCNHQVREEGS